MYLRLRPGGATIGDNLLGARRGNLTMDNIRVPSSNVLPFAPEDRKRAAAEGGQTPRADGGKAAVDTFDHGPSPEESLRIMRAFVGIKNRKLRQNLIDMLEGAQRGPAQTSEPAEK
jgi:hypothetical protein